MMCHNKCGGHAPIGKTNCSHCCETVKPRSNLTKSQRHKRIDKRFRDYVVRTNIDLVVIACVMGWYHSNIASAEKTGGANVIAQEEVYEEEIEAVYAVLFPWFVEMMGIFAYYVLSRHFPALPYTAVMFIIGFCIGFSVQRVNSNAVTVSTTVWLGIEGEVVLLVFLPGLVYLDSYNIDVHLFLQSFWQIVIFAFPMVLGGMSLIALVAYYIFPYGWSFDLCMTFGSILSATDPVAVAVLLNELGAPPRLKMHISGESLMNDGSAVVFYNIFSARFLYELGIQGVGEDIGWGKGFVMFFRLAFGGACIGLAFGIGVVYLLYHLDRRLSGEDNILQVVLTITAAYLAFFISEILAGCSGIIATLFCGVTIKAFGETLMNDSELAVHFWEITEHLLNTLLFALAGCVWGDMISNVRYTDELKGEFEGNEWGYLVLLYVMMIAIRFFLIFAFYPITKRIGIGTNMKESLFSSWAGLRGAVGIALAMSLNSEVVHLTSSESVDDDTRDQYRGYTAKLFGFVGGVAFLTLVINATASGPLLKMMGLVTPTETRSKIIENYRQHMIQHTLLEYVKMLSSKRSHVVDFSTIKEHIPFMRDITYDQLMSAVRKHKKKTPIDDWNEPHLEHIVPYLYDAGLSHTEQEDMPSADAGTASGRRTHLMLSRRKSIADIRKERKNMRATVFDLRVAVNENDVQEERMIFIQILRATYHRLIELGELETRGFMPYSLFASLDFAADAASKGLPLNDWDALQVASHSWVRPAEKALHTIFHLKQIIQGKTVRFDADYTEVHLQVRQILCFTRAHDLAQKIFKEEFASCGKDSLTIAEKIVLDESTAQLALADKTLNSLDKDDVLMTTSHYACQVLLWKSAHYFEKLAERGLVTQKEAGGFLEEIEEDIFDVLQCREVTHKDEISLKSKENRLRSLPEYMLSELGGLVNKLPIDKSDSDADNDGTPETAKEEMKEEP